MQSLGAIAQHRYTKAVQLPMKIEPAAQSIEALDSPQVHDGHPPYRFAFGPFLFNSELDIPELHGNPGSEGIEVTIALGHVPPTLGPGIAAVHGFQITTSEFLLDVPEVARYYVGFGNQVRIQIQPQAAISDITTYLLGSVFGALCHQNGMLPLHASAVEVDGHVAAFLGDSGAGKSTIVACLRRRGFSVVSDDICLLEPQPHDGGLRVAPVAGWLKLWRQSLDHLGESAEERHRVYSTDDKFRVYLKQGARHRPSLAHLFFIERASEPDAGPQVEPLPTIDTIARMMRFTYLEDRVDLADYRPRIFHQCAKVLEQACGYRLIVPWGFDRMDAVLDLVQQTILTPATAPR